jgi:hypothetical protein
MRSPLPVFFAFLLVVSITPTRVLAQSAPLPLGTVSGVKQLRSCPEGFLSGMTCYQAEMSCPNTLDLGFTYGVVDPGGTPAGTIIFHGGNGGTVPYGTTDFGQTYLADGFQIVQVAWESNWEATGATPNIMAAACRPATFLSYVAQTMYHGGGMCAQGLSAGSAAVAYTLAWYGGASFLDKVELLSGPVFADIEKGCEVPHAPIATVCPQGEVGCNGDPWPDSPAYVGGDNIAVGDWTGNSTCNGKRATSQSSNAAWKAMSIVNGTSNPSFSYPHTGVAGWLCSNDAPEQNNSAAEGSFFYQQFTNASQTAGFSVTRIDECSGDEGVEDGYTPQGVLGVTAISEDMIAACKKNH